MLTILKKKTAQYVYSVGIWMSSSKYAENIETTQRQKKYYTTE